MGAISCIRGGSIDKKPGWIIQFPYDPDKVEEIKSKIPHIYREWREESKTWWIYEDYENVIEEVFPHLLEGAKSQMSFF